MSPISSPTTAAELVDFLAEGTPSRTAAALVRLGLRVFPVHAVGGAGRCSCGKDCGRNAGKHPRTANGLLDATADPDQVPHWWSRWPDANVAVATGAASGVWALDVDPAHDGLASIERLEAEHGEIPPTWCVETGGDGLHLWFLLGDTALRTSAGLLGPGLDVRAEGGYVVVPPSRHRSGRRYRWSDAWRPGSVDLAPAPPWLVALATRAFGGTVVPPDGFPVDGAAGGNHSRAIPDVIEEGSRNAALTSLAGAMRRKGAGEAAIRAALMADNAERCRPPLPEAEVARIARSVCRYAPTVPPRAGASPRRPRFVEFVGGKAVAR
jgi:putative DNA primase/helicase